MLTQHLPALLPAQPWGCSLRELEAPVHGSGLWPRGGFAGAWLRPVVLSEMAGIRAPRRVSIGGRQGWLTWGQLLLPLMLFGPRQGWVLGKEIASGGWPWSLCCPSLSESH